MPSTTEMWVHGHAVEVECGGQGKLTLRRNARGTLFLESGNQIVAHWFHIAIPTPTLNGVKPTLKRVFIDYDCDRNNGSVTIDSVHFFDGNSRSSPVWTACGLTNHDVKEWVITSHPQISKGLGITVNVIFGQPGGGNPERSIEFYAAGAEFETP